MSEEDGIAMLTGVLVVLFCVCVAAIVGRIRDRGNNSRVR